MGAWGVGRVGGGGIHRGEPDAGHAQGGDHHLGMEWVRGGVGGGGLWRGDDAGCEGGGRDMA